MPHGRRWGALTPALALALVALTAAAGAGQRAAPATDGARPKSLRVCSDPNNLPFSNRAGEGFENRIAELLGRDLDLPVTYDWLAENRGFARKTINAGNCDLIMGVPAQGYDPVLATRPYYRSTYVFVYRADRGWHIDSFDDPLLQHLKIGIHVTGDYDNPPPARALAARGIIGNVQGFPIVGDYSRPNPPARLIDAVASGTVDVAVIWGPFAGYFAPREPVKLTVTPVTPAVDRSGVPFTFAISLGVRHRDAGLATLLDSLLVREAPAIHHILTQYGVPLVPMTDTVAARGSADAP